MTLPRGYKPPKKKEISDNKDFGNNNNITNKKNNSLTDEILQSTTLDDTINKVLERSNEVVTNLEDTVKEAIEKGKDVIVEDSSTIDKSIKYEDQSDKSRLTQENQMNKKNDYNYSDSSNLGISTDKSSTKEELTPTPTEVEEEEEENKIMFDNKEKGNKDMADNSVNNSKEYKIQRKDESIKDKIYTKMSEFGGTKSGDKELPFNIKSIIFGLFALIGFIILVYSIFVAVVSEPLASIADTVFVAALIGSFTMVGVIFSYSFLKK
ncbi:MAG TPA: hypothetical protein VF242_04585 [Nitrososphaeraceae archaeon]